MLYLCSWFFSLVYVRVHASSAGRSQEQNRKEEKIVTFFIKT